MNFSARHLRKLRNPELGLGLSCGLSQGGVTIPALDLSFTTGDTLDSRITFTRGSSGTRVNSSGLIETITTNNPRFDYDPVTLAAKGLLVEEARTNLMTYSADFSNAAWTKSATTATASAGDSPLGTLASYKIAENSATVEHYAAHSATTVASTATVTLSVLIKAAGRNYIGIVEGNGAKGKYFDLANGTVLGTLYGAPTSATITSFGNGWYLCQVTASVPGTSANIEMYVSDTGSRVNYAGDGSSGVLVAYAQVEVAAFASSYIPTVASQVTRAADVATITGASFSNLFNSAEGTFVASFLNANLTAGSSKTPFSANDNSANWIKPFINTSRAVFANVRTAGGDVASINSGTQTNGAAGKLALAYKANDFSASLNGAAAVTDTAGALPAPDRLSIGSCSVQSLYFNGHIKSLRYYRTRLVDATLRSLSV